VLHLGPHLKGGTQAVGVREHGHDDNIWTQEGGNDRTGEKCTMRRSNIKMNKLRRMSWAGNIGGRKDRCIQNFGRISESKRPLEYVDSMIILKRD
jgi:hypothetical protein